MTKVNLSLQCVEAGAVDFLVRVSGYDWSNGGQVPNQWQAIIKHRDATKPWGVGVDADFFEASKKAHHNFLQLHTEEKKPRKRTRAPAPRVRTRARARTT